MVATSILQTVLAVGPMVGATGTRVTLRHQLTPGMVTVYEVRLEVVRRSADRGSGAERSEVRTGRLTRAVFAEDQPGQSTAGQMLELGAAEPAGALGVLQPAPSRGLQPARPIESESSRSRDRSAARAEARGSLEPSRAEAGGSLQPSPPEVAQLKVGPIRIDEGSFIVPGQTAWQREALAAVVRVTDWLREPVAVGQTWEHPFQSDGLKGRQCYRVGGIETVGSDTQVSLKVTTEVGAPGGQSLPTGAQPVSAESAVVWSANDRELVSLEGQVTCRHGGGAGGRETTMHIRLSRLNHRRMSDEQQDSERRALIQVAEAVAAYQRDDQEAALRQAQRFGKLYRGSLWRPVAEDLKRRIEAQRALAKPLPMEQLRQTLAGLLAQWGEAEADADEDATGRLRKTLTLLTQVNRPELVRLGEEADGVYRALAYFALAFGTAPADAAVIQRGFGDAEARVRRLALYALSLRALPITEVDRVLTLLRDDDATVRSQGCEAIGACSTADPADGVKLRAGLVERLADDSPAVIVAAAKALVRTGSPDDVAQVQQAFERTKPGPLRDALQEILKGARASAPPRQ